MLWIVRVHNVVSFGEYHGEKHKEHEKTSSKFLLEGEQEFLVTF